MISVTYFPRSMILYGRENTASTEFSKVFRDVKVYKMQLNIPGAIKVYREFLFINMVQIKYSRNQLT